METSPATKRRLFRETSPCWTVALLIYTLPFKEVSPTTKRRWLMETSPATKRRLFRETSPCWTVALLIYTLPFKEASPTTIKRWLMETSPNTNKRRFIETSPPMNKRLLRDISPITYTVSVCVPRTIWLLFVTVAPYPIAVDWFKPSVAVIVFAPKNVQLLLFIKPPPAESPMAVL